MILEIHLNNLVGEPKHYSVLSSHPLLDVDGSWRVLKFVLCIHFISLDQLFFLLWIIVLLQVRLEMLKQGHLLLELRRVSLERELAHHILLFVIYTLLSLIIKEVVSTRFRDYFG